MSAAGRCVATNTAGAGCLLDATHGNDGHVWSDSRDRWPFLLGMLQSAVTMYLAGQVDRDFLARTLAETNAAS